MAIPDWLKERSTMGEALRGRPIKKTKQRFLDKTMSQIVSFVEDTMFNETTSAKNGFFQKIEPRIKVLTILLFITALSLQKSLYAISAFLFISLFLALSSRIPLHFFLKKLSPAFLFTLLIVMPAAFNIIVKGNQLIKIYAFKDSYHIVGFKIPNEIYITHEGVLSAGTLMLRVITSISLVFLLTMTTPPNKFIKAVSSFMPGTFKSIISVSYRYIFYLIRKVEGFIIGYKSRNILSMSPKNLRTLVGAEHKWVASRMSLLFSISLRLNNEIERAMEARGYRSEEVRSQKSEIRISIADVLWIVFSLIFMGVMLWKSLM